jgi:ComF family protein
MGRQSLLETLLQLIFPDRCAACRTLGTLFCATCQARLEAYQPDGRTLPSSLSQVHVAYVFQSPLREVIHQLKYRKTRRIAQPLGQLLAENIAPRAREFDAVAAIPLHPRRLSERGFNQAEALAAVIAHIHKLPLITGPLARTRDTAQQAAQANAHMRAANMRDAFAWRGASPPARILLVDDVYTTGATMGACADALRAAGTADVQGLALARTRLKP